MPELVVDVHPAGITAVRSTGRCGRTLVYGTTEAQATRPFLCARVYLQRINPHLQVTKTSVPAAVHAPRNEDLGLDVGQDGF